MIAAPANDRPCLRKISEVLVGLVESDDSALREVADRFATTRALARWIRLLPQRDDTGDPTDGPKVEACAPPQRLRIPAADPNCVERAALYIAAAEMIDPGPVRQLATVDVAAGRHTFPVEEGRPVVLDPQVTRNALEGALFQREGAAVKMTARDAVEWAAALAKEPAAQHRNGIGRVNQALRAMHRVLAGRPLEPAERDNVAWTLGLAEGEARHFGPRGHKVLRATTRAIDALDQVRRPRNQIGLKIGGYTIRPDVGTLGALARVGEHVGERVAIATARAKLAELGLSAPLLREVELELNREGLSLGALARPAPMPGSLEAVSTDALVGRWLASRVL